MSTTKKLILATAVLAAGIGAALVFRKAPPATDGGDKDSTAGERIERRRPAGATPAEDLAIGPRASVPQTFKVPTVAANVSPATSSPPELPANYHHSFSPAGALLKPSDSAAPARPASGARIEDLGQSAAASDASRPGSVLNNGLPPANLTTHKIVDGDTLSKLAARYLGSSDRYREIFDCNRGILSSPELLPIGAVIKIPPRDGWQNGPRGEGLRDAGEPPPLVPVPSGKTERSAR